MNEADEPPQKCETNREQPQRSAGGSESQKEKGMNKYIWMAVDADEYELPQAVADSAKELGVLLGVSKSTIENCEWRKRSGRENGRRIVKVPI